MNSVAICPVWVSEIFMVNEIYFHFQMKAFMQFHLCFRCRAFGALPAQKTLIHCLNSTIQLVSHFALYFCHLHNQIRSLMIVVILILYLLEEHNFCHFSSSLFYKAIKGFPKAQCVCVCVHVKCKAAYVQTMLKVFVHFSPT